MYVTIHSLNANENTPGHTDTRINYIRNTFVCGAREPRGISGLDDHFHMYIGNCANFHIQGILVSTNALVNVVAEIVRYYDAVRDKTRNI